MFDSAAQDAESEETEPADDGKEEAEAEEPVETEPVTAAPLIPWKSSTAAALAHTLWMCGIWNRGRMPF